jgi:TrmH family RNA methyltransferase
VITSTSNPRIKALARLKQRRHRDAEGRFPIEGARAVIRAVEAGWPLVEALFAPELASGDAVVARAALEGTGVGVIELSDEAFRKIAYRQHPDGVLAIGETRPLGIDALQLPERPLLLVVEAIEKPGNLGAMLRTADGAGADAVIAVDTATDPFNPNVVRASQGALFEVPLAVTPAAAAISHLEDRGVSILAAGPSGGAAPWEVDLTGPVALVVGNEHAGLSATWAGLPSISIPMAGKADSLNAASAAAVLLYEAVRQRS